MWWSSVWTEVGYDPTPQKIKQIFFHEEITKTLFVFKKKYKMVHSLRYSSTTLPFLILF